MQPVEIKKDIFWVGCVDYDHRDFHGYSRSPEGSTYNAYLIRDEKNVLMDTVYPGWAGNMLCRIAKIMDPEKIDYIVCNHMEPDHAGSLAEVVARVKPEKIFVSTLGYKSMQGYFDCKDWPIEVVKSGDKLNIGKRNIIFQETRMLHWPDSMVSYIPEDKTPSARTSPPATAMPMSTTRATSCAPSRNTTTTSCCPTLPRC